MGGACSMCVGEEKCIQEFFWKLKWNWLVGGRILLKWISSEFTCIARMVSL